MQGFSDDKIYGIAYEVLQAYAYYCSVLFYGSYDFRQSFDVCAHDDCNVIWINTCAAMAKGKEANFKSIGYVRKRIGRNDDDSQKLCEMPTCEAAFTGKCNRDCIYFETIRGV